MTETVDRIIASLRDHHDRLAEVAGRLSPEDLDGPSAADKWTRAQVLSHLGSGAEIMGARYAAAIADVKTEFPDNQEIWARWDDSTGQQQADGFVDHDSTFVARLEGIDDDAKGSLVIDLGFGPEPMPLETAVGLRLNEVAAHAWDVFAGLDASAALDAEAAELLLSAYAGSAGFLLGWIGKPDQLAEPVVLAVGEYTLRLADGVTLESGAADDATATLTATPEELLRLLLGRLKDGYTADSVTVTGNVTLDQLRAAFPGY